MRANDYQVGGNHYKTSYEHWTLVLNTNMEYLAGCSTKYVARWRKKGGLDDLKKSLHYLNKLEESDVISSSRRSFAEVTAEVAKFNEANALSDIECAYIAALCTWHTKEDLSAARELLFLLIDEAEALLAETGAKPVPLTEENHHADRV